MCSREFDNCFNKNPSIWHKEKPDGIKIASVNCGGLLPHLQDIRRDYKLLKADVLHMLETSLPADIDTSGIIINGYDGMFINVGNGKGLAAYFKTDLEWSLKEEIRGCKFFLLFFYNFRNLFKENLLLF